MTVTRRDFPGDFMWGVATASYQNEGATSEDGRGPSIWDAFARVPGAIADGKTGDIADDHYHRYREDVDLMASLGVNAYRFSIAWPRIQADGSGPANAAGLDFYRRLTETLLERGITPFATLYHWDLPLALEDKGGWLNRDTAELFGEYAALVAAKLGDLITHWITLNEPWCSSFLGYAAGIHAPGQQLGTQAARAAHHLLVGHGQAVAAIRAERPQSAVGVTLNLSSVRSASNSDADQDAARRVDGLQNRFFLEPILAGRYPADILDDLGQQDWFAAQPPGDMTSIAAPLDFLGINYYYRQVLASGPGREQHKEFPGSEYVQVVDTGTERTQIGWTIAPDGLIDVLEAAHRYQPQLPLYITENGAAYPDVLADGAVADEPRRRYLEQHIAACADAIGKGLQLKGYFAWTLTDNFEWAFGYSRRFGLIYVDYPTQQRTVKDSGRWLTRFLSGGTA
jgi:beta-glucosidase